MYVINDQYMIKRILNIIIATILLISTNGIAISKHYCGTHLISLEINKEAKSCCGTTSNCCHTENAFYQVDDDYSSNIQYKEIINPQPLLAILNLFSFDLVDKKYYQTPISKPPGYLNSEILEFTCSLLI